MDNHIHWTKAQADAHLARMGGKPLIPEAKKIPKCKMTKTEMEYERIYLRDLPHKFEGITLRMENSHRYTPDFFVVGHEDEDARGIQQRRLELHEVKGSYKLHSHGRARLAFDQCAKEFPMFKFVWATKTKDGWIIK